MKTLLLMRHAKSSWKDPKLADHKRPLNKRGQKDAPFMGEVLLEKELLPQKILASTAVRVRETVDGLVKSSQYSGEIEFNDALYLAEPEALLAALRLLPDTFERVMLVGHNPGMEGLLQQLSGRIETIETGTVAYLSLPVQSWAELTSETEGELIELLHLHDLRDEKEDGKKKDKKEEKKHKGDKKEDEKKHKEEKAAAEKLRKELKATEAKKHKEEKTAAEKLRKEQKAAEAKKHKEEKVAAEKLRKEEKAAEARKHKEEKLEAEKKHKAEKQAEPKKHKK